METRFSRLLAAYEALTRDESTALREENLDAIMDCQSKKTAIFGDLISAAEIEHARDNASARARVMRLLQVEKVNGQLFTELMTRLRAERQNIHAAANRMKGMRSTYAAFAHEHSAFSTHV